jgi:hypothetical protein
MTSIRLKGETAYIHNTAVCNDILCIFYEQPRQRTDSFTSTYIQNHHAEKTVSYETDTHHWGHYYGKKHPNSNANDVRPKHDLVTAELPLVQ